MKKEISTGKICKVYSCKTSCRQLAIDYLKNTIKSTSRLIRSSEKYHSASPNNTTFYQVDFSGKEHCGYITIRTIPNNSYNSRKKTECILNITFIHTKEI